MDGGDGAKGADGSSLIVGRERREELLEQSVALTSVTLTRRQLADLELLLNGGFAPLTGFMTRDEYITVCCEMRLPNDVLWPMPVTLRVPETLATRLESPMLALRDPAGTLLAVLHVEDVWQPDLLAEAALVFGTVSDDHPGVAALAREPGTWCVGGRVEGLQLPVHHDFLDLRKTPAELRALFKARGWQRIAAFQTRNPLHRAHIEMTRQAAEQVDAKILIHAAVGPTRPGDLDPLTRVRCYRAALRHYPADTVELATLPLAMRMAGPREALWHALIRKNFGCTHLIVGRDHAGPGADANGDPFYPPQSAQELVQAHAAEAGIEVVPFAELRWVPELREYRAADEIPAGHVSEMLSGTELRRRLAADEELPSWFTLPEVEQVLRDHHRRRGCAVFLTGLSGAGKSTVAGILASRLRERGVEVTLLDGDDVRQHLSSELSFSREHRDLNIRRIGFVAAEITRHGGIVICAPIAPYDEVRKEVRRMVAEHGRFVLVHVDTPLYVCEARDPKGLYRKARAGVLPNFTGVSDPYEEPTDAEVVVETMVQLPEESAELLLEHLVEQGVVPVGSPVVIPADPPRPEPTTEPTTETVTEPTAEPAAGTPSVPSR
ncbi:MAG: bifunctional sulfate adenylyltransferase/adenylylsulfate kinase [Planctomycetota bacterium]